jgi:hypothetical protein
MTIRRLLNRTVIMVTLGAGMMPAMAQQHPHYKWVLLGLYVGMGSEESSSVDAISKFPTEPTPAAGEGLPTFPTKAACEAAMKRVIAAYSGKSHADGNYGHYLCTNFETWTVGQ